MAASLPARAAWIETLGSIAMYTEIPRRCPRGQRGLKHHLARGRTQLIARRCPRGQRGLKQHPFRDLLVQAAVAARAGSVD